MIALGEKIAGWLGPRKWPLRYQILFPFTAVMLLAIASISVVGAWLAARASGEETKSRLERVTAVLARARYPLTRPVLEQVKQFSGADFVLCGAQGNLIDSTVNFADSRALGRVLLKAVPSEHGAIVDVGFTRFFHNAALMSPRDVRQGAVLHVLYPVEAWNRAQWRAAMPPLYVGGFAVTAAVILSLVIAKRITRPIVQLRTEVDRLVDGAFHAVPLPSHNDELKELITSVNALAKRLEDYREAVRSSERLVVLAQLSAGLAHQVRNAVAGARIAMQLHQRKCKGADPESLEVAVRQLRLSEDHLNCVLSAGQPQPLRLAQVCLPNYVRHELARPG